MSFRSKLHSRERECYNCRQLSRARSSVHGVCDLPNGGSVRERRSLEERFASCVTVNPRLTRQTVSYQGNRRVPGLRWMKYKEGFSRGLVERLIDEFRPSAVLDPFAGIGTTPLIAASRGLSATGIEIMPVGVLVGSGLPTLPMGFLRQTSKHPGRSCLMW